MLKRKLFLITFLFIAILGILGVSGLNDVEAQGGGDPSGDSAEWIDSARIRVGGDTYKLSNQEGFFSGQRQYFLTSDGHREDCTNHITDFNDPPTWHGYTNPTQATIYEHTQDPTSGECQKESRKIQLANPDRANIQFIQVDDNTIRSVYNSTVADPSAFPIKGTYEFNDDRKRYILQTDENECKTALHKEHDSRVEMTLRKDAPDWNVTKKCDGGDEDKDTYKARLLSIQEQEEDDFADEDYSGEDADEEQEICEAPGGWGWLVCKAIDLTEETIEGITNAIEPFLRVSPVKRVETGATGEPVLDENGDPVETPLYSVWSNVLLFSNVFLVVIFFIFIFAQGLSLNIDAYTIKKALPRLLIAAIGMQLSFYISGFLVDISNILGAGVEGIMNAAVGSQHLTVGPGAGAIGSMGVFASGSAILIGTGVAIYTGGILIALVLLLLGILAVFFTLLFRQVFIVLLVVLSPVAFVLWVLPNTEKFFKMWWDNFIKVLLMYPLIMLLLTSGAILSIITRSANPTNASGPDTLIALVVMAAPLFLIPATFKMAGAGMAGIFAAVSKGKKMTEGKTLGDPKDPNSFRARHNRRVAGRKANLTSGQRGRVLQAASKPTTALPGKYGGYGSRSGGLTSLYRSASNESKAMEEDGINKDAVLMQAINRGGGSQQDMKNHIEELRRNGEDDKAAYIESSRSQLHPYIGKDSSRIAATRNLIESKQIEHEDMSAISNYATTPELAGSLVNEAKYGMRDSRLDMFGYKYNASSGQVEYDIKEAARGLREADPEQIVSQKPRALTNLQDVRRSEMADQIPRSDLDKLEPYGFDAIDYGIYQADEKAGTTPGTPHAYEASNKVRDTFADAMKSAKGSDAATRQILSDYTEEPKPWDVNVAQAAGTNVDVRPGEEGSVPVSPRNQGGGGQPRGGGGGNQPTQPVPPPPGGGQQNPQGRQPQQGPPPGGGQNPQGGNPPQGGGGNPQPQRGVPQPPPPQQQAQPQPQQPPQQNQPQQGPRLPGEQQRSSGLYVPGQDTTGGGTPPEPEDDRQEGDQGYL